MEHKNYDPSKIIEMAKEICKQISLKWEDKSGGMKLNGATVTDLSSLNTQKGE